MATYEIQEVQEQTRVVRRILTDDEVKVYFPPQVVLSADKLTVTADGVDFATITAQLKSVPLSDNTQANLPISQKIYLLIADVEVELTTDANGSAAHEVALTDTGTYSVTARNLTSNTLTLTGV